MKSQVGQGSRFTATLPFTVMQTVDPEPEQAWMANERSQVQQPTPPVLDTKANILVVEDNHTAATGLQWFLEKLNCTVDIVGNGTEAIALVKTGQYQFILTGVSLPDLSGIEMTQKIRNLPDPKCAQVPIVGITGHAQDKEKRQACLDSGMQAVLGKPARLATLKSVLKTYLFAAQDEKASKG